MSSCLCLKFVKRNTFISIVGIYMMDKCLFKTLTMQLPMSNAFSDRPWNLEASLHCCSFQDFLQFNGIKKFDPFNLAALQHNYDPEAIVFIHNTHIDQIHRIPNLLELRYFKKKMRRAD